MLPAFLSDVNYAMDNLYSSARSNEKKQEKMEADKALLLEEQKRILEMDDIVEDDDDSSMGEASFTEERDAKRQKPSSLGKQDPRKVSLSPQEVVVLDV